MKTLNGKIIKLEGIYWAVETDGPPHLETMFLLGGREFQVGDEVKLTYVTTASSGLWTMKKVY